MRTDRDLMLCDSDWHVLKKKPTPIDSVLPMGSIIGIITSLCDTIGIITSLNDTI